VNKSLGVPSDPVAVRFNSFFSLGYNDWGAHPAFVNHGLGGDVDVPQYGEISESAVKNPSDMIMLGDTKADGSFDANIDPTTPTEWPSSRHSRRIVMMFCDGHSESVRRRELVNPRTDWNRRWCNTGVADGNWNFSPTQADALDTD